MNGRLPCHYCGQCGRGCTTASNFSSSQVLIPPAMATGKLTLDHRRDGPRGARRHGRQSERRFVHRQGHTRRGTHQRTRRGLGGERVRIGAFAAQLEIAQFPDGLANSPEPSADISWIRWAAAAGRFPQLEKMPPHNHDGTGGMHMYMPWWKFDRPERFSARLPHRIWRRARNARRSECSPTSAIGKKVTARS